MVNKFFTRRELFVLAGIAGAIALGAVTLFLLKGNSPSAEPATAQPHAQSSIPIISAIPLVEDSPATLSVPATEPPPLLPDPGSPADSAPSGAPALIRVSVEGAVKRPGAYEMSADARVDDLLRQAGRETDDADLSDINRAAWLIDGSTLYIPHKRRGVVSEGKLTFVGGEPAALRNPPQYTLSQWRAAPPVSTETGSPASTAQVPGPPPQLASGLINLNTATQEQLESLPGIGPKLAEEIIRYRQGTPFASVEDVQNVSGIGPKRLEAIRSLVTVQ